MTAQSFYLNPQVATSQEEPECLILNTTGLIRKLRKEIQALDAEENEIVSSVLEALMFRKNAIMELGFSVNHIISQRMGIDSVEYFRPEIEAIEDFGYKLFQELQRLNAYRNGYLFYQYMQMLNTDMVLIRLQLPELNIQQGRRIKTWGNAFQVTDF
jgi:hypothetical protein